jgi:uncharacterized protein YigE (DUF2233 family)
MLKYLLPIIMPWFGTHTENSAGADNCAPVTYRDNRYITCRYHPDEHQIRLFYQDPDSGQVLRNFKSLADVLARKGEQLEFGMNAGMYHSDMRPVGLYVEAGQEIAPLVTKGGWGNFHLLPNGVFSLKDGKASVAEVIAFERSAAKPDYATQSGPMLVIDGALHPSFLPQSDSLKIRNGVGVSDDGAVHFAISQDRVRFYDFALMFRDLLKTPNALYLDGTISSVSIPALGRIDRSYPMGPMIGVVITKPD